MPVIPDLKVTRNILDCHGRLLLVVRSCLHTNTWNDLLTMRVFELDVTSVPAQHLELSSLNGDNIFVSKMYGTNWQDEVRGNQVLAVDKEMELVVFRCGIVDATTELLPVNILEPDQAAARKNLLWVFQE